MAHPSYQRSTSMPACVKVFDTSVLEIFKVKEHTCIFKKKQIVDVLQVQIQTGPAQTTTKIVKVHKLLDQDGNPRKNLGYIYDEIDLMNKLRHPNIVKFHLAVHSVKDSALAFLMPKYDTLANIIERGPMKDDLIETVFIQVACAMRYMHERSIVHCDVKPWNIFADSNQKAILADLDTAKKVNGDRLRVNQWSGTSVFMAPELPIQKSAYDGSVFVINPFKVSSFITVSNHRVCFWSLLLCCNL